MKSTFPIETYQTGNARNLAILPEYNGTLSQRIRAQAGLTKSNLASRLGLSATTLAVWEKGKRNPLQSEISHPYLNWLKEEGYLETTQKDEETFQEPQEYLERLARDKQDPNWEKYDKASGAITGLYLFHEPMETVWMIADKITPQNKARIPHSNKKYIRLMLDRSQSFRERSKYSKEQRRASRDEDAHGYWSLGVRILEEAE